MAQLGEMLSAPFAKWLRPFRCVDLRQSDFDLLIGSWLTTSRGQSVAIADGNNETEEQG